MRYGVLGEKLSHSFSPLIYKQLGIHDYTIFEVPPHELESFVCSGNFAGLNVTIPYKKAVVPFCDTLSDTARALGNVNTLRFDPSGRIHGDNTDYAGFVYMARRAGIAFAGKKVIVLGTGGASVTAAYAAKDRGAREVVMVSRAGPDNYDNIHLHSDADIVINGTPVGMYPKNDGLPIDPHLFPALTGAIDLVYNPLRSCFVLEAAECGAAWTGGLSMLAGQGRAAAELFLSRTIPESETERVYTTLLQTVENIVLIGMPGSGKSAVGQAIAERLGRHFQDTDELIAKQTGRHPAQIIERDGEEAFRTIEAAALQDAARQSGLVIATGGGAVLNPDNRMALRQTGRLYWLDRPLDQLDTVDRPLSRDLPELFARRAPIYEAAADARIDASPDVDCVADAIIEEFHAYTCAERPQP